MVAFQSRPRYEHITGQAEGVGTVPFLQNHYRVMYVAVQKFNPEVGAPRRLTLVALH